MNPYENLEARAFWKLGVAEPTSGEVEQLWFPKFKIGKSDAIATAGSCFAQNIGRALKSRGMNWLVTEKAPGTLPKSLQSAHGYGLFSFRTGNIYSPVLLEQWVRWAFDRATMEQEVWEADGRYFDPFRPSANPNGFETADDVLASRDQTAEAVKRAILDCDVFLFTPGLTETWVNTKSKSIYPACPGTVQGDFDQETHRCVNFGFQAGKAALSLAFSLMQKYNPTIKLLLTVSPVPITATVSRHHAITASTYTKSVLRAIVGEFANENADVDYFPSFDLVSTAALEQSYFNENKRTISQDGIDLVMRHFFEGLGQGKSCASVPTGDIVCEDEILEYYGKD